MLNGLLLVGLVLGVQVPSPHVATYYTYDEFGGNPLYCSRPGNQFYYELDTTPWVAVNVRLYQTGVLQCGDWLLLVFENGEELVAQALDAGPFDGYYVADYPHLPIIDIPEHLAPFESMSMPVSVFNISANGRWDENN